MEAVTDFNCLGSKITVDSDCSFESKGHLLPGKKAMTNLDSILKSRDITFPLKVYIVKTTAFPVSRLFTSDDQNTGASASVLPDNIKVELP